MSECEWLEMDNPSHPILFDQTHDITHRHSGQQRAAAADLPVRRRPRLVPRNAVVSVGISFVRQGQALYKNTVYPRGAAKVRGGSGKR